LEQFRVGGRPPWQQAVNFDGAVGQNPDLVHERRQEPLAAFVVETIDSSACLGAPARDRALAGFQGAVGSRLSLGTGQTLTETLPPACELL
jgi:hypothetical protein